MSDHYTIISADCHAGGSHEMYREYLDPAYLDEFDAWREKYKNPFRDLQDGGRIRNWDDDRRNGDLEARRHRGRGRVPEHGAAVLPELHPVRPAAEARGVRAPTGRHPRAQPLARRLVRALPRAPRRHRPDLPERRRRSDQGRALDQGARPARRRTDLVGPARLQVGQAVVRPGLRPAVAGVRGARGAGEQPRRHRHAGLRQVPRRRTAVHHARCRSTRSGRSCS